MLAGTEILPKKKTDVEVIGPLRVTQVRLCDFAVHAVANVARMALILTHRTRKISEKAERNAQDFVNYFSGKAFGRRLGEIVASAKLQRSHIDAERAFF